MIFPKSKMDEYAGQICRPKKVVSGLTRWLRPVQNNILNRERVFNIYASIFYVHPRFPIERPPKRACLISTYLVISGPVQFRGFKQSCGPPERLVRCRVLLSKNNKIVFAGLSLIALTGNVYQKKHILYSV